MFDKCKFLTGRCFYIITFCLTLTFLYKLTKNNNEFCITGSSLGNYTPKGGYTFDDFQLGVTRSNSAPTSTKESLIEDEVEAIEEPVLFSSGTNSDILF